MQHKQTPCTLTLTCSPRLQHHYVEPEARYYSVSCSNLMGSSAVRLAPEPGKLPPQLPQQVRWQGHGGRGQ